jgi:hypothetical protein
MVRGIYGCDGHCGLLGVMGQDEQAVVGEKLMEGKLWVGGCGKRLDGSAGSVLE